MYGRDAQSVVKRGDERNSEERIWGVGIRKQIHLLSSETEILFTTREIRAKNNFSWFCMCEG